MKYYKDNVSKCLLVVYLVVEVTGISQTVDGEETLPNSTSQTRRNTHPDESLNLKTQQECEENKLPNESITTW